MGNHGASSGAIWLKESVHVGVEIRLVAVRGGEPNFGRVTACEIHFKTPRVPDPF